MYRFIKRFFDITISLMLLPLILLLIIIFSPIIFLEDKGPVFYCGYRIGRNGKLFKMIKFRTMRVNAPDLRLEDGSTYNSDHDERVTRIGKFLRSTSIDELPQIFNVLIGQMSYVGPRPDTPDWLEKYPDDIKEFLKVRPGVTGYSQAYFRNSVDGIEKMKNDLYYAQNISFLFDLRIIFKTIITVFKRENTYKEDLSKTEFGYEYEAEIDDTLYSLTRNRTTDKKFLGAYCLASGRDALKAIAMQYSSSIVLLPALVCDTIITPFRLYDCTVKFYRYKEDLSVDFEHLIDLLEMSSNKTTLLLYMDYFGIKTINKKEIFRIKSKYKNVIFINDTTQSFLNKKTDSRYSDYVVASVRKWTSIPDGGLLWSNKELNVDSFSDNLSFFEKRLYAQSLKNKYKLSNDVNLKKEYREIFKNVSLILDSESKPIKMSEYSYNKLSKASFKAIRKARIANSRTLIDSIKNNPNIKMVNSDYKVSNLYVPVLLESRNFVQKKLAENNIFATVIWPITDEQKSACENAKYFEEHMLALPCDQRYGKKDMEHIANVLNSIVSKDYR